ncbi:hypothetical protein [Salibacterium qingdaonense]|uniref:Uncharacterized protein n=1 Tax=Salibacterium qingdaonense TaxID=266892 RepID=A0A1I4J8I4_9BACI|nr:hypothetical protein [Salibacterium qingdaonense]SFL62892.1 hypothetical protein SAMN04488054_10319 [Salibacterium qingdaonense]
MTETGYRNKNKKVRTTSDPPPTIHEDLIPLEDLKIEEKEMKQKHKSKNSSSSDKKQE